MSKFIDAVSQLFADTGMSAENIAELKTWADTQNRIIDSLAAEFIMRQSSNPSFEKNLKEKAAKTVKKYHLDNLSAFVGEDFQPHVVGFGYSPGEEKPFTLRAHYLQDGTQDGRSTFLRT